nr:hypothetical protein [Tanacetum cinerariifolium]
MEWYHNLRIVLSVEDKLPFLEQPIPALPVPAKGQNLEHLGAYDMLKELKTLYAQQADQELFQTVREFHVCKQEEGQSVSSYILKMKSCIDNLERLGHAMTQNLSVSLILVSLGKKYDGFVQNYNMHNMRKTATEFHAMLKLHEQTLPPKEEKSNTARHGSIHDESNYSSKVLFVDYALESAARILNMVPTKKVEKTPYEVWHGQVPKLSYLKVWGCETLVKRDTLTKPDKLEPRSIKCIFVGYPKEGWSTRTRRAPYRMCLYIDAEEYELGDLDEPANYKAALLESESDKWLNAMNVEMQSMKDNEVWKTIPMQEKPKCSKSQGASTPAEIQRMQNSPYASAVRSIMYAVRCTHPDVAFAQNLTSRFQQNPVEVHWTTVKNILKYLHNTKDMFLVYGGDTKRELRVSCYTDDGYLADADDMKSQTGYVFVLNGGAVC